MNEVNVKGKKFIGFRSKKKKKIPIDQNLKEKDIKNDDIQQQKRSKLN